MMDQAAFQLWYDRVKENQQRLTNTIHGASATCAAAKHAIWALKQTLDTSVPKSITALHESAEALTRAERIIHHNRSIAMIGQLKPR